MEERIYWLVARDLAAEIERLRDDNASLRDQVAQLLREAQEREAEIARLRARLAIAQRAAKYRGGLVEHLSRRWTEQELLDASRALDSDAAAGEEP